jgi:hypothetical protein
MNPSTLISPSNPLGFPAPYWFIAIFKVLGFVLHMSMMNIWFAGPIIAMFLFWRGGHPRTLANRIMKHMPIIIAYGINFGIIPLLFVQVAYYKAFYPSTILMAWPWFSVFILLTFAYYGIYIYSSGLYGQKLTLFKRTAGWVAAILFIIIGFIFSNEFSLLTNLDKWHKLWQASNVGGAVLGLAMNTTDPTLWPRWLMIFGLAITTTSAYIMVDAGLFPRDTTEEFRRWLPGFAFKLYLAGMIWYAAFGSWYVFGAWAPGLRHAIFSGPIAILAILTAISPGLTWLLIMYQARKHQVTRFWAIMTGLAQFGVLALNAISRQIVQNKELGRYFDPTAEKVNIQWSPLIIFLLLFVLGVALIIWMIRQASISREEPAA